MFKSLGIIDRFFAYLILIIIIIIVVIAIHCCIDAYGETWIIDDGKVKSVYENYDECFKEELSVSLTEICDDLDQVYYKEEKTDN